MRHLFIYNFVYLCVSFVRKQGDRFYTCYQFGRIGLVDNACLFKRWFDRMLMRQQYPAQTTQMAMGWLFRGNIQSQSQSSSYSCTLAHIYCVCVCIYARHSNMHNIMIIIIVIILFVCCAVHFLANGQNVHCYQWFENVPFVWLWWWWLLFGP